MSQVLTDFKIYLWGEDGTISLAWGHVDKTEFRARTIRYLLDECGVGLEELDDVRPQWIYAARDPWQRDGEDEWLYFQTSSRHPFAEVVPVTVIDLDGGLVTTVEVTEEIPGAPCPECRMRKHPGEEIAHRIGCTRCCHVWGPWGPARRQKREGYVKGRLCLRCGDLEVVDPLADRMIERVVHG